MRRKVLRIVAWTGVAIIVALAGLVLYLQSADLSVYQESFEARLARETGLQLDIAGRFELRVGSTTEVVAEDLTLSNPEWQEAPEILRVGHLAIVLDTWSFFRGPLVVLQLEVSDVDGRSETVPDRASNWRTSRMQDAEGDGGAFDTRLIAFRRIDVSGLRWTVVDPARTAPVVTTIDRLTVEPDASEILDLDLRGTINDLPLWADGRLGPWPNLIDGKFIDADLDVTLGSLRLSVHGSADDLPYLDGILANATLAGPEAGRVIKRLGLPPFAEGAFELDANISRAPTGHQVRVEGNVGAIDVVANGSIDRFIAARQADFDFSIGGRDLQNVAALFGVDGAPAKPFRVAGDMSWADGVLTFSETQLSVATNRVVIDGTIDTRPASPDGRIAIRASGPDFSVLGPFIDLEGLPAAAFDIQGEIRKDGWHIQVDGGEAAIGEDRLAVDGAVTLGSRENNHITIRAQGPDISVLQNFTELQGLPARPYDVNVRLASDPAGIGIKQAIGQFGDNRLEVQGVVARTPGLAGTVLDVKASGPELQNVALLTGVPYLPAGAFDLTGKLAVEKDRVRVDVSEAGVGELAASGSGQFGIGNRNGLFDVSLTARGPDTAAFVAVEYLQPFSGEPFDVSGKLRRSAPDDIELDDVRVDLGGHKLMANGKLSLSPTKNSSDLRFAASGPNVQRIGEMFGFEVLADRPYDVEGAFTGVPAGFTVRDLVSHVGDSNLSGQFTIDLADKPRIRGELASEFLDVSERVRQLLEANEDAETDDRPAERIFPDTPIPTELFDAFDLDLRLQAAHFRSNTLDVQDLLIGVRIEDGRFEVDPFRMREGSGSVAGTMRMSPLAEGYAVSAAVSIEGLRLGLAAVTDADRSTVPPLSGHVEFQGSGVSPHAIMAASNGEISLRQGSGRVRELVSAIIFRDIVAEVLRAINPLDRKEPYRTIECSIFEIGVVGGLATIEQLAVQSDRLLIVASGSVDLGTEQLNLTFRTAPREGVGVSLGSVLNSLLAVRGTMVSPHITIDKKGSVTTTGAAVATGGLSLLARSLWDRLSAEKSICEDQVAPTKRN